MHRITKWNWKEEVAVGRRETAAFRQCYLSRLGFFALSKCLVILFRLVIKWEIQTHGAVFGKINRNAVVTKFLFLKGLLQSYCLLVTEVMALKEKLKMALKKKRGKGEGKGKGECNQSVGLGRLLFKYLKPASLWYFSLLLHSSAPILWNSFFAHLLLFQCDRNRPCP